VHSRLVVRMDAVDPFQTSTGRPEVRACRNGGRQDEWHYSRCNGVLNTTAFVPGDSGPIAAFCKDGNDVMAIGHYNDALGWCLFCRIVA
jgi:hypothetical protein